MKSWFFIKIFFTSIEQIKVKFDDVKGCDEVKKELEQVVDFLKKPERFDKFGGKLPKGVLMSGMKLMPHWTISISYAYEKNYENNHILLQWYKQMSQPVW